VLLLALSVGAAAWWFGTGRFVAVPPLANLSRAQAATRVADAGLDATFTAETSESVPDGRVVRSQPGTGDRVLRGRSVTVVLSSGRPPVPVPDVAGQPQQDAVATVQAAGLAPQVTEQHSDDVEPGLVISQDPPGGTARRGSPVRLAVSTGPEIVTVPGVRGRSIEDATRILQDAGFTVKVRSLKIGNVIAQSPRAGSERKHGSTVTIYGL
jgi:serine/threonine-protein kinase